MDNRLSLLLSELEAIPPCEDPPAPLMPIFSAGSLSLAAILDVRESLQAHADHVFGLAGRTEQVVKRCLDLPPSPTPGAPLGF